MNKNYIYLLVIFLFCGANLTAQNIKIKKDIILIDNIEAARIEKKGNKKIKEKSIVFYDLNSNDSIEFRHYTLAPQQIYYGIHTSFSKDTTADMKLELLNFTFNEEKALTELIIKKYKFITSAGLQKNVVEEYIVNQTEKEIPKALIEIARLKAVEEEINAMKLAVSRTWEISQAGKVIGSISNASTTYLPQKQAPIIIFDTKNNEIARIVNIEDMRNISTIEMYDSRQIVCKTKEVFSMVSFRQKYLLSIIRELAKNEYLPGQNNSVDVQQRLRQEEIIYAQNVAEGIIKSKTIVYGEIGITGYQSEFGFFDCQFRQTEEGDVSEFKGTPMIESNNYDGKEITFFPKPERNNEDGLNKVNFALQMKFTASECSYFVISAIYDQEGKYTKVEEGYAPIEFSAKNNGKVLSISNNYSTRFAQVLSPKNYVTLYRYRDFYVLSLAWGKKNAIGRDYFTKKDLLNFAKDYPAMVKKIDENDYLNGVDGLIQFTKDFDQVVIDSLRS